MLATGTSRILFHRITLKRTRVLDKKGILQTTA